MMEQCGTTDATLYSGTVSIVNAKVVGSFPFGYVNYNYCLALAIRPRPNVEFISATQQAYLKIW